MTQDEEHLRLLSIFHYVVGGMTAFFACFPCIHLVVGIAMVSGVFGEKGPPLLVGWLFVVIPAIMILIGWTLALVIFVAGRFLSRRINYTYCFVVAAVECVFMPVGTVLGIFTIIVLNRTSVRALFHKEDEAVDGSQRTPDLDAG